MNQELVIPLIKENGEIKPDGNPLLYINLKDLHPGVNWNEHATPEQVEAHGYGIFEYVNPPSEDTYDINNEAFDELPIAKRPDGVWSKTYPMRPINEEEKRDRYLILAGQVRTERSTYLRRTDYIFGIDAPQNVTAQIEEWKTYRQALRDIPLQESFPWNVTWPLAPSYIPGNPTAANNRAYNPCYKEGQPKIFAKVFNN
jgi:hypothetical protein